MLDDKHFEHKIEKGCKTKLLNNFMGRHLRGTTH